MLVESAHLRRVEVGPWPMNAYVVIDPDSDTSIIVDPGADGDVVLAATDGSAVQRILLTHTDPDHIGALAEVVEATGAPVAVHPEAAGALDWPADEALSDGDQVKLGTTTIHVIATPGHAPGHISFLLGRDLIGGDVLFPGGPGHTQTPEDFEQILETITAKLLTLPDDTVVHPGHGDPVTIWQAREEYRQFERRDKPANLCGDVTWA
jgi:hydroxyacylglutathione hydrolase